jgi:hypothetical protein
MADSPANLWRVKGTAATEVRSIIIMEAQGNLPQTHANVRHLNDQLTGMSRGILANWTDIDLRVYCTGFGSECGRVHCKFLLLIYLHSSFLFILQAVIFVYIGCDNMDWIRG